MIFICIGVYLYFECEILMGNIGGLLKSNQELIKYLAGAIVAVAIYTITASNKIRFPSDRSVNKKLYEWPMYEYILDRVNIAFFFAVVSSIVGLFLWLYFDSIEMVLFATLFFCAIVVVLISAFNVFVAGQTIKETLEKLS